MLCAVVISVLLTFCDIVAIGLPSGFGNNMPKLETLTLSRIGLKGRYHASTENSNLDLQFELS